MAEEQLRLQQETPSRIERKRYQPEEERDEVPVHTRPGFINFALMISVAVVLDIIGAFSNEVPGVGVVIVLIADVIFIPWFHFSGMKMNGKRIISTTIETVGESIPLVGNAPLITINVILSYYLN
jgi:hypothetical protein